ncbi:MAG TPA: four-helix bundle copper-binding protein, partial [Rhizomicrobium sp.]
SFAMDEITDRFSAQVRACMESLAQCHATCLSSAMTQCFELGGEHVRPQHIRLMLDCAAMCSLTTDLLAHKSQFHNRVCALCAEVCDVCAADCERLGQMEHCAASCRKTAALCREAARLEHAEVLRMASMLTPGA